MGIVQALDSFIYSMDLTRMKLSQNYNVNIDQSIILFINLHLIQLYNQLCMYEANHSNSVSK